MLRQQETITWHKQWPSTQQTFQPESRGGGEVPMGQQLPGVEISNPFKHKGLFAGDMLITPVVYF